MRRNNDRYAHKYQGSLNSRGKRKLSKLHKGLKMGNVEKAFKEVEKLNEKEQKLLPNQLI